MCEFCGTDGTCCVCGGADHDEPRRQYAKRVATVCSAVLLLIVIVAGVCAVVNQLGR